MVTVSIITPHFDGLTHLKEALDSVVFQTYQDYEHIIVDDGSDDKVQSELSELLKLYPKTKLVTLERNQGAAIARNRGIDAARGRYIAFIDADDLWQKDKLAKQISLMDKDKLALTYSDYQLVDASGEEIKLRKAPLTLSYQDLLKCNYIGCSTAIYDTNIVGKQFMPLLRKRQDHALWLKIAHLGVRIKGVPEPLVRYRKRQASLSANKFDVLKYQWWVYRRSENLSLIKSLYYFCHYAFNGLRHTYKS